MGNVLESYIFRGLLCDTMYKLIGSILRCNSGCSAFITSRTYELICDHPVHINKTDVAPLGIDKKDIEILMMLKPEFIKDTVTEFVISGRLVSWPPQREIIKQALLNEPPINCQENVTVQEQPIVKKRAPRTLVKEEQEVPSLSEVCNNAPLLIPLKDQTQTATKTSKIKLAKAIEDASITKNISSNIKQKRHRRTKKEMEDYRSSVGTPNKSKR